MSDGDSLRRAYEEQRATRDAAEAEAREEATKRSIAEQDRRQRKERETASARQSLDAFLNVPGVSRTATWLPTLVNRGEGSLTVLLNPVTWLRRGWYVGPKRIESSNHPNLDATSIGHIFLLTSGSFCNEWGWPKRLEKTQYTSGLARKLAEYLVEGGLEP